MVLIDVDGTLTTTDDQRPEEGWVFRPEVLIGSVDPESATTDAEGSVTFTITPASTLAAQEGTLVDLFEVAQVGYELLGAGCVGATNNGLSNDMDAVTGIVVGAQEHVECTFINASETLSSG